MIKNFNASCTYNKIIVVQSLPDGELKTGLRLAKDELLPLCNQYDVGLDYVQIADRNHFFEFMRETKKEYQKEAKPFPLHKYIHHGLSSQAMLFNLLGEVVLNRDFIFLSSVFSFPEVNITNESELLFEYSDRHTFNENQQQPTSFDFVIKNKNGKNIFIEAKYIETEFGKCSTIENGECDGMNPVRNKDLCYLTSIGRTYWKLMHYYKLDQPYINSPICPFAVYYQFYRELMFALENNAYYVLLLDKRNPAFLKTAEGEIDRGLVPFLTNLVPEEIKPVIKIVYIQDIIEKLEMADYKWTNDFKVKYGI
jgi:hypothetical protein